MIRQLSLFFLFFFSSHLFGEPTLKNHLSKAHPGDFIAAESNQTLTLLWVHSIHGQSLIFEEVTAPLKQLKEKPSSWEEWIRKKAPGHTSWSMIEIDLKTGDILECYSFSRAAWIDLTPEESLFATLLKLPLHPISQQERRKIGPPPNDGEKDHRQIWQPPLVFEGKTIPKAPFDGFTATWPHDGTHFDGKQLTLYFAQESSFPLPYWIQLDTSHITGHFRVIDSGRNLSSPHRSIPRRAPQFIGSPKKIEEGLLLFLKSPKYFRKFDLFAIDITAKEKQIYPIPYSLKEEKQELLTLHIDQRDLEETLQPEHRYTWLLVPEGSPESYTETLKSFTWVEKP